jgi:hypothetical protein
MDGGDPGTNQGRQDSPDKGGQQDCWQQTTLETETMHSWKSPSSRNSADVFLGVNLVGVHNERG